MLSLSSLCSAPSLSLCLHSATHGTNARRGHSRAAQQRPAQAGPRAAHSSRGRDLVGQRRATRIRGAAAAQGGPARAAGKRRRPRRPDLRGIFRIPVSHPSRSQERSHGCHNNEKRGTGTYQLGDLRGGAGRRPLARSVDEARDESPSDVGDEKRGTRDPHPSGFR